MTIEDAARILAETYEEEQMHLNDRVIIAINQVHRVVKENT